MEFGTGEGEQKTARDRSSIHSGYPVRTDCVLKLLFAAGAGGTEGPDVIVQPAWSSLSFFPGYHFHMKTIKDPRNGRCT